MKKIFSIFAAILFAGSMMADTYSMTPDQATTKSSSTTYVTTLTSFTYQGVSWKINQWNPKTLQVKTNQSSAASEFRIYNTSAFAGAITQVVVKFSSLTLNDTDHSGFMFVGGNAEISTTTGGTAGIWDDEAKTLTWTPAATDNFTFFALYQNGKVATGSNYLAASDAFVITTDAAPAVAIPVISGEDPFFDATSVTLSCTTEGADIYYTLDGTDPTEAAEPIKYMGLAINLTATTTVKAAAYDATADEWSAVATKTFNSRAYASFEDLIAAELDNHTIVQVSFENLVIDSFYVSSDKKMGVYFTVNDVAYEIYKKNAEVPAAWEVNGKVSGTIRGDWYEYINNTKGIDIWEIVPSAADWAWTELTYEAPQHTAIDNTNAAAKAVKAIENGRLVIIKNGVRYDVTGAELK